jgi:ABC-2 type transport system ATP-binding protein
MGEPIRIDDLHKSFGPTAALDGLDLTVTKGEVHGFLGPNGSGKSPPTSSCSCWTSRPPGWTR